MDVSNIIALVLGGFGFIISIIGYILTLFLISDQKSWKKNWNTGLFYFKKY